MFIHLTCLKKERAHKITHYYYYHIITRNSRLNESFREERCKKEQKENFVDECFSAKHDNQSLYILPYAHHENKYLKTLLCAAHGSSSDQVIIII